MIIVVSYPFVRGRTNFPSHHRSALFFFLSSRKGQKRENLNEPNENEEKEGNELVEVESHILPRENTLVRPQSKMCVK